LPTDNEFTRILQWPGYRVYRHAIDEKNKTLELWVRHKRGNRKLECSGCGRKFEEAYDANERAVRDLPWSSLTTTVHIEVYRVKCPECGVKIEKVPLLPSKAPFSKRFEDAVGQACESAAARQVARRFGLAESTVRAIDHLQTAGQTVTSTDGAQLQTWHEEHVDLTVQEATQLKQLAATQVAVIEGVKAA
jgi:transposase